MSRLPKGVSTIAVALAVLTAASCTTSDDGQEGRSESANQTTADELRDEILTWDGVDHADATYQDNATAPGNLAIEVVLLDDVDPGTTRDDIYRIVWQSEIEPLHRIALRIAGGGSGDVADYSIRIDDDTTSTFDEQFGERP